LGDQSERPDDDWADWMAKRTFAFLVVLAVLYVGTVFAFILR
jgi:hypothetical protein